MQLGFFRVCVWGLYVDEGCDYFGSRIWIVLVLVLVGEGEGGGEGVVCE